MTTAMPLKNSLAQSIAFLPEADRAMVLRVLTPLEAKEVYEDWRFWARPEQIASGFLSKCDEGAGGSPSSVKQKQMSGT